MVLKAITAPHKQGGFLLPKFNNERVVSDKVQRVFYTQIVRNDAKLSSEVERNHAKKLKVR